MGDKRGRYNDVLMLYSDLEINQVKLDCMIFNPLKRGRGRLRRTLKEIIIRGLRVIISLEIWFLEGNLALSVLAFSFSVFV